MESGHKPGHSCQAGECLTGDLTARSDACRASCHQGSFVLLHVSELSFMSKDSAVWISVVPFLLLWMLVLLWVVLILLLSGLVSRLLDFLDWAALLITRMLFSVVRSCHPWECGA